MNTKNKKSKQDVENRYRLLESIGKGSFGKVYLAQDQQTQKYVAIKTQCVHKNSSHILKEIPQYKHLDSKGFPTLISQGISLENEFIYLVSELLGPSLEDLFHFCGGKFSLMTTCMVFFQLLERVEYMHNKGTIHRDIKPDNIMLGLGPASNTVHLIDFGLTRSIIDPDTSKHIAFSTGKGLIGTCRYVSANSHKGHELSRRDDLITLGYVIIRLLTGSLPWQFVTTQERTHRQAEIGRMKDRISNSKLCHGCPVQFKQYMDYVMKMQFDQNANFRYLKELVLQAAYNAEINIHENAYDWSLILVNKNLQDKKKIMQAQQDNSGRQINGQKPPNDNSNSMSANQQEQSIMHLAQDFTFQDFSVVKMVRQQAYQQQQNKAKSVKVAIEPRPNLFLSFKNKMQDYRLLNKEPAQAVQNEPKLRLKKPVKKKPDSPEWSDSGHDEEEEKSPISNNRQQKSVHLDQANDEPERPNQDRQRDRKQSAQEIRLIREPAIHYSQFKKPVIRLQGRPSQTIQRQNSEECGKHPEERKNASGHELILRNNAAAANHVDHQVAESDSVSFVQHVDKRAFVTGSKNQAGPQLAAQQSPDAQSMVHAIHQQQSFDITSIVDRLNNMQSALSKGNCSNQKRLDNVLGDKFDAFKEYHAKLLTNKAVEIDTNREQLERTMQRRTEVLALIQKYKDEVRAQQVENNNLLAASENRLRMEQSVDFERNGSFMSAEIAFEPREEQSEGSLNEEHKSEAPAAFMIKQYQDVYHESSQLKKNSR